MHRDKKLTAKDSPLPIAIGPTTLIRSITVNGPGHLVTVRGEVTRLTPFYAKDSNEVICVYGDLADEESQVSFKLKPNPDLQGEGQHIEIIGTVKTSIAKYAAGFNLRIDGEMVRTYHVDKRPVALLNTGEAERPRVSLYRFLQKNPIESLFLITTETGLKDFLSGAQDAHIEQSVRYEIIKITSKTEILNCLDTVARESGVSALGIVRGGGATADLRLWDDARIIQRLLATGLPYYCAVGHSDKLLLIDKYSMESFPVPFAFGQAVGHILGQIRHMDGLSAANASLQKLVESHETTLRQLKKWIRRLSGALLVLAVLFCVILFSLYNRSQ